MSDRYSTLQQIKIDNITYLQTFPNISPEDIQSDNDIYHKVTSSDRFDLLAQKYYNDATKWWVIMLANRMALPTDLKNGLLIRIPISAKSVESIVKRKVNE